MILYLRIITHDRVRNDTSRRNHLHHPLKHFTHQAYPLDGLPRSPSMWCAEDTVRSRKRRYCNRFTTAMTTLLTFLTAAPRVRGTTIANSLLRSELLYTYTSSHQSRILAFVSTALVQDSRSVKRRHYVSPTTSSTTVRYYASKSKPDEYDDLSTYDATYNLSGYQ